MTDEEWRRCSQPRRMLDYLHGPEAKVSVRKMLLFSCASCRQAWSKLEEPSRQAVEVAERFAEGLASTGQFSDARWKVYWSLEGKGVSDDPVARANNAVYSALINCPSDVNHLLIRGNNLADRKRQAALLTDIFGNPFHLVTADVLWRTPLVVTLATDIYEGRAFDRMPILADALEEAGCTESAIVKHCRETGPHVRGCWVVDLLLGLK